MLHQTILACEAWVYAETLDSLGVSFTTSELFHGTVAECLAMLSHYPAPALTGIYIETVDGAIHLDPSDILSVLAG